MTRSHQSHSEEDTARIARAVVGAIGPGGGTILLYGELGAGKTAFVRGVVDAAGGAVDEVSSPTFVLMQEYAGGRLVHHVDLYRLGPAEVSDLEPQLQELMAGDAIVAIEWADRLGETFPEAVQVRIEDLGADDRRITIVGPATVSGRGRGTLNHEP